MAIPKLYNVGFIRKEDKPFPPDKRVKLDKGAQQILEITPGIAIMRIKKQLVKEGHMSQEELENYDWVIVEPARLQSFLRRG